MANSDLNVLPTLSLSPEWQGQTRSYQTLCRLITVRGLRHQGGDREERHRTDYSKRETGNLHHNKNSEITRISAFQV